MNQEPIRLHSTIDPEPAYIQVGFGKNIDPEPAYIQVGLNRTNRRYQLVTEVYKGSFENFGNSVQEQDRIHNLLKISPSDSEKRTIDHYGGSGSNRINSALWENHKTSRPIEHDVIHHINKLDEILKPKTSIDKPFKLYSGLPKSPISNISSWADKRPSKVIRIPAYTSSTSDLGMAIWFTDPDHTTEHHFSTHHGTIETGARHVLEMPFHDKIHSAASIQDHVGRKSEREILLGRGYEFLLHSRPTLLNGGDYEDPIYLWHAAPGLHTPNKTLK
jgi:hypothetical protein